MPTGLHIESHIVSLRPYGEELDTYVKHYRPVMEPTCSLKERQPVKNSVTLIFLHGLAGLKELWEPMIERLFELEKAAGPLETRVTIADVWAIDSPDHGESAVLNEDALRTRDDPLTCIDYARTVVALSQSGLISTRTPSFSTILVGHCGGAVSAVLSTRSELFTKPMQTQVDGIILISPWLFSIEMVMSHPDAHEEASQLLGYCMGTIDTWSSREEALAYFGSLDVWKTWDPRVLRLYVHHGITALRSQINPAGKHRVTLSYPRARERRAAQMLIGVPAMLEHLPQLCRSVPVHIAFGEKQTKGVRELQRAICNQLCPLASITDLPNTGHKAVQQSPSLVAEVIWNFLLSRKGLPYSKL
ncbi:Alpha/Beta hydrolase protein [Dichomitus squalens]|nr:Alpha/Beta hydrolase protein [Dichomitus squalens]